MSRERLGLFDTPPTRQQIGLGLAIAAMLFASVGVILPMTNLRLIEIPAFIPMINATMFVCDLIIGTLLYAQATVFRSRALTVLGSGYVLAALLVVPHTLTFPGAFTESGLLGAGVNTTGWIATFRWLAFPIAIILYAIYKRADSAVQSGSQPQPVRILGSLLMTIALAALLTLLTTVGHDLLPSLFLNAREVISSRLATINLVESALAIVAVLLLFRQDKSVLDMWLLVASSAFLAQLMLNYPISGRFTLGFYWLYIVMLVSNLVVMLALIAESNRLYARLALSAAERDREYETRLMSMDGVAAAIAHEVGQPLAAVTLNARGGMNWLKRSTPHPEKVSEALQNTLDAAHRALDVISSIRATFARGSGAISEFSFNDLVLETTSLLDRDLAVQKISLQFALGNALPPVRANRVQLQRVLVNLLTNAIEAVAQTGDRRISIRSSLVNGEDLLLQVEDSGAGIAPEKLSQIFEPFFTTKSNGTGLGLLLSRTIAEDHGGRLWASSNEGRGATFHLQVPTSSEVSV